MYHCININKLHGTIFVNHFHVLPLIPKILFGVKLKSAEIAERIAYIIFMIYVIVWSLINKKIMPKSFENFTFLEKVKRSKQLLPVILLILIPQFQLYRIIQ